MSTLGTRRRAIFCRLLSLSALINFAVFLTISLPHTTSFAQYSVDNTPVEFQNCQGCHGSAGQGNADLQAPRIAGLESWYLKRQLENFRTGIRGTHPQDAQGLIMQPIAALLDSAIIVDIADWLAGFEFVPTETTIKGNANRGRDIFRGCQSCHGEQAEGNQAFTAPALAGSNDWYLVSQLQKFRAGYRGTHEDDRIGAIMIPMARMLDDEQAIRDVVSYINSLGR